MTRQCEQRLLLKAEGKLYESIHVKCSEKEDVSGQK
jgi:hypothetical protein